MLGDYCPTHQCQTTACGCANSPDPCIPDSDNPECEDWIGLQCAFWKGDDIAGTPITKNTRASEIILYLLDRIKTLEDQVNA